MAPSVGFWKGFKKTLVLLMIIGVVATGLFYLFVPSNKGLLLSLGTLVLVLNLGLMLLFTRANDHKRPDTRSRSEQRRYDFHKDR